MDVPRVNCNNPPAINTLFYLIPYPYPKHNSIFQGLSVATSFGQGAHMIAIRENANVGVQWDNAGDPTPGILPPEFTFAWACYMLLIDAAIYAILAWYIEIVNPGRLLGNRITRYHGYRACSLHGNFRCSNNWCLANDFRWIMRRLISLYINTCT